MCLILCLFLVFPFSQPFRDIPTFSFEHIFPFIFLKTSKSQPPDSSLIYKLIPDAIKGLSFNER